MTLKKILAQEQFDELAQSKSFLLVKHSLTCPVSQAAFEEYQEFAEANDVNTAYLTVQEARPLSNYVAEKYSVKHESPQAILFKNGEVAWHASHWKITNKSLREAVQA
ncbi:bacillithiol system redox-active protein YtxJ [Peribacillus deserti]|uniref:Bacillithiol system redox-active protein YtxJ n=1 Tax=Peribacillus deserti TaxID=673318 RepID=A0A2N5MAV8_9BACI|nr:bacillithiol system redox-active protein YtxJ [Peribacillus deserti]PLT31491.1 bacillithiol system redox-active protein YtxJ [Peribacillus deserti]